MGSVNTIKNAKDKQVNVAITANEKLTIKNNYAGDPKILKSDLEYLQTLFNATENHLYEKTAEYIKPDTSIIEEKENLQEKFIANFKNDISVIKGEIKSVPEDIFKAISMKIFSALEDSKMKEYSATDTRQWLSNVLTVISRLGVDKIPVKVGNDNYQIDLNNLIGAGSGTSHIVIKKNNKMVAELNWTDNPKHMNKVIEDYWGILTKLEKDVWWNVIKGIAQDIGGQTAAKYIDYAKSIITALSSGNSDEVIDSIKKIVKREFTEYISGEGQLKLEQLIKDKTPNGRGEYILNAAKSFKSLIGNFNEMKSKFSTAANLIESGKNNNPAAVYESFVSLYDDFEKNESAVINNINGKSNFLENIKNNFNDLLSNIQSLSTEDSSFTKAQLNSSESQALAVGQVVYIDEAGNIVDSDTNAIFSVNLENDTFIYNVLTNADQKISIGTSKDKFNFAVNTFEGNDTITAGSSANVTINSGAGNDSIKNSSSNSEINGADGNDIVINIGKNVTVNGGSGNDTVSLGGGSDVYVYSSGNDLIQDYTVGQDKIKITSGTIASSSVSSSNVILNISNGGKITIQNGKDKEITFIDSNGKEFKQIYSLNDNSEPNDSLQAGTSVKSSVLTATNKFTGNKIDLADYPTVTKLNASTVLQSVNIVGNTSANSIKGGKGADTISGGFGNDTLTGGTGKDLFVYSSGNDVITDYKVGEDKIKIGTITKSSVKGSDVILTTSNGNLTVKGVKDKVVTFVDNAGKTTEKIFFADTSYAPLATGLSYDAKRTVLTASNKFTDNEIDLGEYLGTVTKVNASATSKSVDIIGNSFDNSIKAGKGADTISSGNGKDTIWGGAGNDSIYGGYDNDKL